MKKNLFRLIVSIPPLIFIILIMLPVPTMPHVTELYYEWWLARPMSNIEQLQYYGSYLFLILLFISSIGVIFFRNWARPLYLTSIVLLLFIELPQTPMLIWSSVSLLDNMATLAIGCVLTTIYSSHRRKWFS